jgi:ABC-type antimicrobial peptide transport system permease subunit
MERVLQMEQSDSAFLYMIMFILYLIVGFGILGTVIMMTNERKREFCMMISLGMSRMRLALVVSGELLIKSLIGVTLALIITLPVAHWFHTNPIQVWGAMNHTFVQFGMEPVLPMSIDTSIFTNQVIAILVISLFAMIYPVRKILKLELGSLRA